MKAFLSQQMIEGGKKEDELLRELRKIVYLDRRAGQKPWGGKITWKSKT